MAGLCLAAALMTAPDAPAAAFGRVVPLGGQAADIALDEPRGLLYATNFTAARLDVVSLADGALRTSYRVSPNPAAVALSPDGRFLLMTHFSGASTTPAPGLITVVDWQTGVFTPLALPDSALAAAFGSDGVALILTTREFRFYNPYSGRFGLIQTVADVTATTLPAVPGWAPVQIVAAAMAASRDGHTIFGLTEDLHFRYETGSKRIRATHYTATPPLGPRVVSASDDGGYYAAGWGVFDRDGVLRGQFPGPAGLLAVGSHAVDTARSRIYAQIPDAVSASASGATAAPAPPVLMVVDSDNLTVRERLRLPENLTGRALLAGAGDMLYAVSESGVLILPVGGLDGVPRLSADREDLAFDLGPCPGGAVSGEFAVIDPGGRTTSFTLSTDLAGVRLAPASGRTPAVIRVTVDPFAYRSRVGTLTGSVQITSAEAVNVIAGVRLLVRSGAPGARGAAVNLPGKLVDIAADPVRDRLYILRQDRNEVAVTDTAGHPLQTLRVFTTPSSLALTPDARRLLIGHENSQLVAVYDLESLEQEWPVAMPPGHYPRAVAASSRAILAASRVVGLPGAVDRIDLESRTGSKYDALGPYRNELAAETAAVASPNGRFIFFPSADGNVLLYDAATDAFTVSRKVAAALSGAYAASSTGQYAAGDLWLNATLVPGPAPPFGDYAFGAAFAGGLGVRFSGARDGSGTGTLQRIDTAAAQSVLPVRVVEQAPVAATAFTRTLAPLRDDGGFAVLTASGYALLPWNYDRGTSPPRLDRALNSADLSPGVAPGTLVSLFGQDLGNGAASCLLANGVPVPVLNWSPVLITAQLPFDLAGSVLVTAYAPQGASNDVALDLRTTAPAIFRNGSAGPLTGLPAVVRESNGQLTTPSNPLHGGDRVVIYAGGLGRTSPPVAAGVAAPSSPLSAAVTLPQVRLGGIGVEVLWAGLAPGTTGVYQINARLPGTVPTGTSVPLSITSAGMSTTIDVRVVE